MSFALLVYVSSWMKCYYPDVFACALLNSMPMGFYQPAQIIIDARKHGVEVRPADVNLSQWDHTLEETAGKYRALRLGFRQIRGMREADAGQLIAGRCGGYKTIEQIRDAGLTEAALERLADADAFRSMEFDRRQALWHVSAKDYQRYGAFTEEQVYGNLEDDIHLPAMRTSDMWCKTMLPHHYR